MALLDDWREVKEEPNSDPSWLVFWRYESDTTVYSDYVEHSLTAKGAISLVDLKLATREASEALPRPVMLGAVLLES